MKLSTLAARLLVALGTHRARADDMTPEHQTSMNGAMLSDYHYRGILQTRPQPALSGAGAIFTVCLRRTADSLHNF